MTERIPKSRSYLHVKCGQVTVVSGGDFENVASPLPGVSRSMCAACGMVFPVSEFQWDDSGEAIVSYYDRYRANVPLVTRWLCSRQLGYFMTITGFLAGVGIGIWSANALGILGGIVVGFVSSFIGALAGLMIWGEMHRRVLARTLGVADTRCLK